jgi:hypothetical protein
MSGEHATSCEWTFLDGSACGDAPEHLTAGGLHLCSRHYTDWARGIYRPIAIELSTGLVRGGITNGHVLERESQS